MINIHCLAETLPPAGPRPDAPVTLTLADPLLDYTQDELARLSDGRREALVVWAGRPTASGALVSHVITLGTRAGRRWLNVPPAARAELAATLRQEGLLAFADLHTHPARAFLSKEDQTHPFSARPGFYALVVPHFARGLPGAGWHAYESTGTSWNEVTCNDRFTPWP